MTGVCTRIAWAHRTWKTTATAYYTRTCNTWGKQQTFQANFSTKSSIANDTSSENVSISSSPISTLLRLPQNEFGHVKMLHWMKQVGETFQEGDSLAELDSDLAVIDYKAPSDGVLALIVAKPGDKLRSQSILAVACDKPEQIQDAIAEYEADEGISEPVRKTNHQ